MRALNVLLRWTAAAAALTVAIYAGDIIVNIVRHTVSETELTKMMIRAIGGFTYGSYR